MNENLYENQYQVAGYFSFGSNWRDFLKSLGSQRIKIAEQSLVKFLGDKNSLRNKTFADLGAGSGLFSLAAYRLGAKKILSVDVDEVSLSCVTYLKQKAGNPKNWLVKKGSVLNPKFLNSLGKFDLVYAWGVLHHTGDMYKAIKNVATLVNPSGKLYCSIYNHNTELVHGPSTCWLKVKNRYNLSGRETKLLYYWLYATYLVVGLFLTGKNPLSYIKNYQSTRGMSFKHDILDWLGGYPYEFARPSEIISYLINLGFTLQNINLVNSIGCNEYLFVRNIASQKLPKVTVLMSVYNGEQFLVKTLKSIFNQTLPVNLICINDASTDRTTEILSSWQKKIGNKLRITTNKENLGLTKSLNTGLSQIDSPYTARIDVGDWWEPIKLEKQINFLESNPSFGLVGSWYINHGQQKKFYRKVPITDNQIRQSIIYQNPFAHSSVTFRTHLVQKAGGYDESIRYGQDYELWLRLLPKTNMFNLPEFLCHRLIIQGISIDKQKDQMGFAMKTRLKYIRQYRLGWRAYYSLLEPALVSLVPRFMADLIRRK